MKNNVNLPDYVASAVPNPVSNRVGWLTTTAATYAGIMLWFVFWQDVPSGGGNFLGGMLVHGLGFAIFSLLVAATICFACFYIVPGLLGMKTGLPLYIVGTSTYGVNGGFFMPGFLMGALQFGWLAVNSYFSGMLLAGTFGGATNGTLHMAISIVWAIAAAWVGLNGIQYVGRASSFTPILPFAVLGILLAATLPHVGKFNPEMLFALAPEADAEKVSVFGCSYFGVLTVMGAYIVGFFATAGAAGCDFGMNNKDAKAVCMGGLVGVFGATVLTGLCALLIICGAYSMPAVTEFLGANADKLDADKIGNGGVLNPVGLMNVIVGAGTGKILMFLLAVAAFPPACFSTLIGANSFKTTLPKVKPGISCGIGVLVAIGLVLSTWAGQAVDVFTIIGASFGPVCGSMMADYLLAGRKWAGPRAGFNPAGWLAWIFGFAVGSATLLAPVFGKPLPFTIPCPPVSAFLVGLILYFVFAKLGLESKVLAMPQRIDE